MLNFRWDMISVCGHAGWVTCLSSETVKADEHAWVLSPIKHCLIRESLRIHLWKELAYNTMYFILN